MHGNSQENMQVAFERWAFWKQGIIDYLALSIHLFPSNQCMYPFFIPYVSDFVACITELNKKGFHSLNDADVRLFPSAHLFHLSSHEPQIHLAKQIARARLVEHEHA